MASKSQHPFYTHMIEDWQLGLDSYEGERKIKSKGSEYLMPTSGQREDGYGTPNSAGQHAYDAMLCRAVYPDIYAEAVNAAIGIMHREPAKIDLPAALEPMRENCTLLGESLLMVLRRINAQQLITGRVGLLADIRTSKDVERPILVLYNEMDIPNWDDTSVTSDALDVRLVLLDESGPVLTDSLNWEVKERFKVLALVGQDNELDENGIYCFADLGSECDIAAAEYIPVTRKGVTLDHIPFTFINSKDLSPTPEKPPLSGLASLCLTIYRGEADYRQHLFMQSQDTLVRIGAQDEGESVRTGAGAVIDVRQGGDAKYIGVTSTGLSEQRQSLENDYKRATQKSGQLTDATSNAKESGDALRIRVAAQSATLPQIAQAGAAGLQLVLRSLARWYGANEEEVIVTPNLNFTAPELDGKTLVELLTAKGMEAPLSSKSIHAWAREQGFTSLTYEEEIAEIKKEEPLIVTDLTSPPDLDGNDESEEGDDANE